MDRITFDFETGEIITQNDAQEGSMIDLGLKERKMAILEAAGLEVVPAEELADAVDEMFKELGFDNVRTARKSDDDNM